jgi:hypothetical protein
MKYGGLADRPGPKAPAGHHTVAIRRKCCRPPVTEPRTGKWTPAISAVAGFHDARRVPPVPLTHDHSVLKVEETDMMDVPDWGRDHFPHRPSVPGGQQHTAGPPRPLIHARDPPDTISQKADASAGNLPGEWNR